MAYVLSEAGARVLAEVSEAGSCVVCNQGSLVRLLAGGEYIKCMPDTPLRLLAFGFLETYGDGRLTPTRKGHEAADMFREGGKLWRSA